MSEFKTKTKTMSDKQRTSQQMEVPPSMCDKCKTVEVTALRRTEGMIEC